MRNLNVASTICVLVSLCVSAFAGNSVPVQAKRLIKQRDALQQQLLRTDQKAADAILIGEYPIELYAHQTGLQEQIDVMQMRLESLAVRLDFDIPDVVHSIESVKTEDIIEFHMTIGRERSAHALKDRCESLCQEILLSIKFGEFLDF